MPATVYGAVLHGMQAIPVAVQADLLRRLPSMTMVGSLSATVREAEPRVRSAIRAAGFEFPRCRVVVSLSPADVKKDGTAFDLPVALAVLSATSVVDAVQARRWIFAGELDLEGELRGARGTIAIAWAARAAGFAGVIVPEAGCAEAALVSGVEVRSARTLREIVLFLNGAEPLPLAQRVPFSPRSHELDLKDVVGQELARAALEVAAAGGHNLLMVGPPGCGKTMLASRLPGILPPLTEVEALECTRVYAAGTEWCGVESVVSERPFRAPHYSSSTAAMVGNCKLRPGEASLAHNGVLFLDEFPEFRRDVREALRLPLEERRIRLSFSSGSATFPASFSLVAAANVCPCGHAGNPRLPCTCHPSQRMRYRERFSGPILDRIDLRVDLEPVLGSGLWDSARAESSSAVGERVVRARRLQYARNGDGVNNAAVPVDEAVNVAAATNEALSVLREATERIAASARVARRMLRVARTVADLEAAPRVEPKHVLRALSLRSTSLQPETP